MQVFSGIICCVPAVPAGISSVEVACQKSVVLMWTISSPQTSVKAWEKRVYRIILVIDKWMRLLSVFKCFQQLF